MHVDYYRKSPEDHAIDAKGHVGSNPTTIKLYMTKEGSTTIPDECKGVEIKRSPSAQQLNRVEDIV